MHPFLYPQRLDCRRYPSLSTGEPLHQIGYVLRLRHPTASLSWITAAGKFEVEIERISKEQASGKVITGKPGKGEPAVRSPCTRRS